MIESPSITRPADAFLPLATSGGGHVIPCTEDDIPQVADLHVKVFYQAEGPASEGLRAYYRQVFFENPWREEDLPSWVYRSREGRLVGFLGVIPRRMTWNGRSIRVAVAHRLMVAPDSRSPLAAMKLLRALFAGPQDLALSDGANDSGHRFWEGSGGSTVLLYSMNWIRPLRPVRFLWHTLKKKQSRSLVTSLLRPLCSAADSLAGCIPALTLRPERPVTNEEPLDAERLVACIARFSEGAALRPRYDRRSMEWLLTRLVENRHRGDLKSLFITDDGGIVLGACLYYLRPGDISEVVLLTAREDAADAVLKHVLYHAWQEGAAALQGRFDPRFLKTLMDNQCVLKRGCWAGVHSRHPELMTSFHRGDAFLTALEGELWLRAPGDRL